MYSKSPYWPSGVPESLWQFGLLVPESRRDFPFVGIVVTWEFVAAFLAGCILICAFAWRRFSEPTYDVNATAFREFKQLTIWNLKDSVSLRRAYVIYCVSLILIYGMLAFFGRLIVQLFDELSISGLQIGMGTIEFDSWRWPLFLALGISGFAPLVNPLVPAENWLRRFSHEVVGIPTRLMEKTLRLMTLIDGAPSEGKSPKTSNWVKAVLGPKLAGYFALAKNLKTVVLWSYEEHVEWSDPEIRRKLNEYEKNVRDETEAALADFEYLTDPAKVSDPSAPNGEDRLKELEKRLLANIHSLEVCRDKFALIMAIYCEYGSRFEKMECGPLRESIVRKFVDKRDTPASGLSLYWFFLVFVTYYFAVDVQIHPPISAARLSEEVVSTTAALETLKLFLLIWLPTTAVSAFVNVAYGRVLSDQPSDESSAWALLPRALAALVVAAIGMVLFAVLYSALPASNTSQMWQSLFGPGNSQGALIYYLMLTPIAAICFWFVALARASENSQATWKFFRLATGAAALTIFYLGLFTNGASSKCRVGNGPSDIPIWRIFSLRGEEFETCFAYYETLTLLLVPACVFVSVLGIGIVRRRSQRHAIESPLGAASFLAAACVSFWFWGGSISPAQAKEIVVGFRTDIPPFSYTAPADQATAERPYLGYLAELCYEIFDNSGYEVISEPIYGNNRFLDIRRQNEKPSNRNDKNKRIDVLCDAITIRLDDPIRVDAGVLSPIVFVSGVSYLWRSIRIFADVEVGYLENSTAERVAKEACTVDALRLGSLVKTPHCFYSTRQDCLFERERGVRALQTKSLKQLSETIPAYVLCPMKNHDDLIRWFCTDTLRDKLYFGDREIILGKLSAWRAAGLPCDAVRDPFQTFTYEPYALLVSKADMELFSFVQRRVYELFSHRAGAEALFYKWFPGQTMSEPLAWQFSLNGVMEQEQLLSGKKSFPTINHRWWPLQ